MSPNRLTPSLSFLLLIPPVNLANPSSPPSCCSIITIFLNPCPPPLKESVSSELDMTHICTYPWSAGQQLQTSHSSNWTVLCDYMWPINIHYTHTNSCGWCYNVSVYWAWFENHFAIHHDWPVEFTSGSNKDTIPHWLPVRSHFISLIVSHQIVCFFPLWNPIPSTQMSWASTLFGETSIHYR